MNPRSSGNPAGIITLVLLASAAGSFYWATMSGMAGKGNGTQSDTAPFLDSTGKIFFSRHLADGNWTR